jgi:myo-inositol catabolism protein IolS
MEKRICQNSGLELSVIGTGCWVFGGGYYWGDCNQKDVNDVVHGSVDLGINYFDTAEAYNEGRSESSLGLAIQGLPRDKILIGTKVSPSNCYKNILKRHCEKSLERLKTDYIDLYMIHWPLNSRSLAHFTDDRDKIANPPVYEEAFEALQLLKQEGKIINYGVSNFSKEALIKFSIEEVAVNELPYNLLCRAVEFDILPFCYSMGIGVIGYMALLQGILADIYPSFELIPKWQRRTRHFNSVTLKECRHGEHGIEEETKVALDNLQQICIESGIPMAELSLRWILENPSITCTLVGTRNIRNLEMNVKSICNPLSRDIKIKMDEITHTVMEKLGNHFDYYESIQNERIV